MDTFDLAEFFLTREFEPHTINIEQNEYKVILNKYFQSDLSNIITEYISYLTDDPIPIRIYNKMRRYNLFPINYERKSVFLVHVICSDASLAKDYVDFLMSRQHCWSKQFILDAIRFDDKELNEFFDKHYYGKSISSDVDTIFEHQRNEGLNRPILERQLGGLFGSEKTHDICRDIIKSLLQL